MRTIKNYKPDPEQFWEPVNEEPSLTLPNEALTMRQMLVRYAKGIPMDSKIIREQKFDPEATLDSQDLEKLRDADLFEKEEFMNRLGEDLLRKAEADKAKKAEADKAEAERKAKMDAEYQLFKNWKASQGTPGGSDTGQ